MIILFWFASLLIFGYCLYIVYMTFLFKESILGSMISSANISVIIPCRNEKENIGHCLHSLTMQTFPGNRFEVILINDFSEDHTVKIAEHFRDQLPLTIIQNTIHGKKNALMIGVAAAVNDIIITTDADCTMHPDWLSTMLSELESRQLNMLCGPVNFNDSERFFEQLQQAESAAVVGLSAVMLNSKRPSTCNGANLMFRKAVFNSVGGYADHLLLASGDDDLLMHKFYKLDPARVGYSLNKKAMVYTKACEDFNQFLHQRMRWLTKRKYYTYVWNGYLQMLVFAHLLAFYFLLFYACSTGSLLAISAIVCKYVVDLLFGKRMQSVFSFRYWLILLMPFYESYIVLVLLFSVIKKNQWKGRSV